MRQNHVLVHAPRNARGGIAANEKLKIGIAKIKICEIAKLQNRKVAKVEKGKKEKPRLLTDFAATAESD